MGQGENTEQGFDNLKDLADDVLEAVSGGVDLSAYTQEDLAEVLEHYYVLFGSDPDGLAAKLATFGTTADDFKQSQRIAVRNGSTSFWPWYLAGMLKDRYA